MATASSSLPATNSLLSPSFQGLLWTNLLTVINDNAFRWLVIGIGKDYFPPEHQGWLLMVGSVCFVAPYILFASVAGWLADRFSKRNVVVACKILEIAVMIVGFISILAGNFNMLLVCTFLMGTQSALFAPAKVGTLPELLDETRISTANGFFNLAALSGTIIGMALGGMLKDLTGSFGQQQAWVSGCTLIGIAIVGTVVALPIKRMPIANPRARFPITLIGSTLVDLYKLWQNGPLFRVALGISYFWAIGALAQLNIDQFAFESGAIYEQHRTPLLVSLVLGVGLGSVLAGIVSAGRIELGLVPWGALGISLFAILIYFAPEDFITFPVTLNFDYVIAAAILAALGISAGFFDVPLASYLQHRSPLENRGTILSAVNFMMFSGMLVTFAVFYVLRAPSSPATPENMPADYQLTSLSEPEQNRAQGIIERFKSAAQLDRQTEIELIKRLTSDLESPRLREVVLANLLWYEMNQLYNNQIGFTRDGYYQQFSEDRDKRVVKHAYEQSSKQPLLSTRQVFLVMGLFTVPIVVYAAWKLYLEMSRILLLWILRLIYRVKVTGLEHIPERGAAVLVGNHSNWIDGALWLILIPRRLRMLAWAGNFNHPIMRFLAAYCRVILITGGPKSIIKGLKHAADSANRGYVVGLFPEGLISKTGQINAFKPGMMKILDRANVPVIPVYVDQIWGSIFTYAGGKALWRWPRTWRHRITLTIGKPMSDPSDLHKIRQAVMNLSADAVANRQPPFMAPPRRMIKRCKQRLFRKKVYDSTGVDLTGGQLLMRIVILRRLLSKHVLGRDENTVGVLLPPSSGGLITNAALALDRRVAVNLNYTVSSGILNQCIEQAGIQHVLTSRKVMDKFNFDLKTQLVFLEDLREKLTAWDKLAGIAAAYAVPGALLARCYQLHKTQPDDLLTIIFTSGSTGMPKGVMLTHQNIASNADGMDQVVHLRSNDVVLGVLPFFHSFGFLATLWAPLYHDVGGCYHFSPLDARQIGKLVKKNQVTFLLATPTFLRSYFRKCTPEQFSSLDVVVTGAERLPPDLQQAFEDKFGIRPVEGYGATELSPVVSLNVPPSRSIEKFGDDCRDGSVGRPIPNVAAKILDLDHGQELGVDQPGMLWIKGPNVMQGYLHQPELTAKVIQDGWYQTGDVAKIDADGFIHITGRISRFSKIGGEMVPHLTIEEHLGQALQVLKPPRPESHDPKQPNEPPTSVAGKSEEIDEQENDEPGQEIEVAVTALDDPRKGERLIVLHTRTPVPVENMIQYLKDQQLPNIYIPSANSFFQVESIPLLGTGKLDLHGIKKLAEQLVNEQDTPSE